MLIGRFLFFFSFFFLFILRILIVAMAKIIGEPDSIGTIRHYLLSQGISDIESMEEIYEFYMKKIPFEDTKRRQVQKMLEVNTSFLIGAIGEEKVINTLRELPDSYYVLNEIQIKLKRAVLWKKYLEYIKSAQIDHIVLGPTGIFLIETKNWESMDVSSIRNSPHKQIERAGTLFWIAQKHRFSNPYKFYNVVVTLKELPQLEYKYVYQLPLDDLNKFILSRMRKLTLKQIEKIKNWLVTLHIVPINK